MESAFSTPITFDLFRVGHCGHPECIALAGGRWNPIEFPALVGLFEHPTAGLILYDTGYSRHFPEATRRFPECLYRKLTPMTLPPEEELLFQLEDRGIERDAIGTIIISHFHADHISGLRDFPKARFIATSSEYRANQSRSRSAQTCRAFLRDLLPIDFEKRVDWIEGIASTPLPENWSPFTHGHDLLGDGSLLGIDLPGHTDSQLGLAFLRKEAGEFFLVADAVWKIEGLDQNRRPARIAYVLFADGKAYDATFDALRELHGRPDAPRMIPSHCTTTWLELGNTRTVTRE